MRFICSGNRWLSVLLIVMFSILKGWEGDQNLRSRIIEAARLAERGEIESAIRRFELLYNEFPDNREVVTRLGELYLKSQRYERGEELIRDQKKRGSKDPLLDIFMGRIFYRGGDRERAERVWRDVLDANHMNAAIYIKVADAMIKERLFDEAVDVYYLGRERTGNKTLFIFNLENLFASRMEFGRATDELLRYLKVRPENYSIVEQHIYRYPKTKRVIKEVVERVREAIKENPENIGLRRVMAGVCLWAGLYSEGLKATREVEERLKKGEKGTAYYYFGMQAFENKRADVAEKAYEEFLERYPSSRLVCRVCFELARCYEVQGNHSKAIGLYRRVSSQTDDRYLAIRALYNTGVLLAQILRDPVSGEETFAELVDKFPDSKEAKEAKIEIGKCRIMRGNLDDAETLFRDIIKREENRRGDLWVRSLVEYARVKYMKCDFNEALSVLKRIDVKGVKRQAFQEQLLNDGLRLRMMLDESIKNDSEKLRFLSRGELLITQGRLKRSVMTLDSMINRWPDHYLTEFALLMKGRVEIEMRRYGEALKDFKNMYKKFPTGLYADRALERIGWTYEKMGRREEAGRMYDMLLTRYPQSFLCGEVRSRIQRIERQK